MKKSLILYGLILTLFTTHQVHADDKKPDDSGRLIFIEENDTFASHDDRHYTQGVRLNWLTGRVTPEEGWNRPYEWLSDILPIFGGGDTKRKYEWTVLGQSLFTPANIQIPGPSPKDRPYGAWLYGGVSLLQQTRHKTHDTLEDLEVLIGVVGPLALGHLTQNDFHQLIAVKPALGWQNQIHNEPGLVISYERMWRFEQALSDHLAIDAIPQFGGSVGNIFIYGDAGVLFRFGQNLAADYGASHIRPALSGTGWFDKDRLNGPLGWSVFFGTQGRAVARNIFLDGNTFRSSLNVSKRPLVADFLVGASAFWSDNVRLDFTVVQRTREFYGQRGHPDRFGSIGITIGF